MVSRKSAALTMNALRAPDIQNRRLHTRNVLPISAFSALTHQATIAATCSGEPGRDPTHRDHASDLRSAVGIGQEMGGGRGVNDAGRDHIQRYCRAGPLRFRRHSPAPTVQCVLGAAVKTQRRLASGERPLGGGGRRAFVPCQQASMSAGSNWANELTEDTMTARGAGLAARSGRNPSSVATAPKNFEPQHRLRRAAAGIGDDRVKPSAGDAHHAVDQGRPAFAGREVADDALLRSANPGSDHSAASRLKVAHGCGSPMPDAAPVTA